MLRHRTKLSTEGRKPRVGRKVTAIHRATLRFMACASIAALAFGVLECSIGQSNVPRVGSLMLRTDTKQRVEHHSSLNSIASRINYLH